MDLMPDSCLSYDFPPRISETFYDFFFLKSLNQYLSKTPCSDLCRWHDVV